MATLELADLARLREITAVLARHGFGHFLRPLGLDAGDAGPAQAAIPWPRRVRDALVELGPTFVKLGQVLSVRPDIVPRALLDELESLQDAVPPAPWVELRAQLEAELGGPLAERFRDFDEAPLASASIAQVHRATLRDGTPVAVKVQRPGIEPRIRSDLHILYALAQLANGRIAIPGLYTPVGIVQEFDAALRQELDFLQEARAAVLFRDHLGGSTLATAPRVYREWSTARVLVLELLVGRRIGALRGAGEPAREALRKLISATYDQVFVHGFFHGDPHPGNVLVLDDGRLGFLDFGLCGRLSGEMQETIVQLFVGLVTQDAEAVALTLARAGATEGRVDLKGFSREVERLMVKYHGATLEELGQRASLVEFVEAAARFRIRLVPEYAVLARTASILDGIARELVPDIDIVAEVRPYAERLIRERLHPERLGLEALRVLQHARAAFKDVPIGMNQVLGDLERGSLRIQAADPEAPALRAEIRHAGLRVALALCAAALSVCGALLVQAAGPAAPALPYALGAAGLLAAGAGGVLMALLLAHLLLASRLRPAAWGRRLLALVRFVRGSGR